MFTGLIEAVGQVSSREATSSGHRLRLQTTLAADLRPGDSVAVNGVCLTVTKVDAGEMQADIGPETARVTTLGALRATDLVNLERAMRAGQSFGGHFVQGHVDGTGTVDALREQGDAHWLTIAFPDPLAPFLIPKGSIAVDGISLTVAQLDADRFDVMIIPFTWQQTNLASRRVGDRVNLECDMLGKHVVRALEVYGSRGFRLKPDAAVDIDI